MFDQFLGWLVLSLFAGIFGVYQYFKMKQSESNSKLIDLEVKGAHNEAKSQVDDQNLDDLIDSNNKRYGKS